MRILPRAAPRTSRRAGEPVRPATEPPSASRAIEVYLDVARERVAIGADELEALVLARFGLRAGDPVADGVLHDIDRDLLDDPDSPVTILAPDVVVHVPAIVDGTVLTHRLTADERTGDRLDLDTDLAGFLRVAGPRAGEEPLHVDETGGDGPLAWTGPSGWLADLPVDALLAVRVTGGAVTITVLDAEPALTPDLTAALRVAYDAEVDEPWLPISAEDLIVGMLHRDRAAFAQARPPLTELAAAAGLERRGDEFAHEESVWRAAADADRQFRFGHGLDTPEQVDAAEEAFRGLTGSDHPADLRRVLDRLQDPEVITAVVEELLHPDGDPQRVAALVASADRLLAVAGSSPRAAVAGWIAAVAAERDGRPLDGESHLRAASVAAAGWPIVEDRLAWYESDRGDAGAALGRWVSIEAPGDDPDVAIVARFAAASGPEPGRNEPCWCGSGRKFKQCHLGRPAVAPLPDRVRWLHRKAAAYVERRGGAVGAVWDLHAEVLAGTGEETTEGTGAAAALDAAYADPLAVDTVLHEGGWFERFLTDRGPLLPADEAQLAASWLLVDRTVFEVVDARPAGGLTVRDLRTGDHLDITEHQVGRDAAIGGLVCARAVPDGDGHQFVGAVFGVPAGREHDLLDVLASRDALDLLDLVATLSG